jgi:hypothetical protein
VNLSNDKVVLDPGFLGMGKATNKTLELALYYV